MKTSIKYYRRLYGSEIWARFYIPIKKTKYTLSASLNGRIYRELKASKFLNHNLIISIRTDKYLSSRSIISILKIILTNGTDYTDCFLDVQDSHRADRLGGIVEVGRDIIELDKGFIDDLIERNIRE